MKSFAKISSSKLLLYVAIFIGLASPIGAFAYYEGGYYSQGGYYAEGYYEGYYQPYYQPYYQGFYNPTVTTDSAGASTPSTASLFGSITVTGGQNSTVRGFAYSTNSGLVTGVTTTTESGSFGVGAFSASIASLLSNTTYFYRAYSTNPTGTGYGSILSFSTGNSTPSRHMMLFEGFKIKLISNKIILY